MYLGEIWPRKGMRLSEAGGRFSHGHISWVTSFFSCCFRGPVAEAPPEHCVKKTWVKNGLDGVFCCFRVFGRFSYLSYLGKKRDGIPFLGHCPILFRAQLPQNSKFKFESSLKAATTVRKRMSPITSAQSFCLTLFYSNTRTRRVCKAVCRRT